MRFRFIIGIVVFVCLSVTVVTLAQEACPAIVEAALESLETICADTARNQACYGNDQLMATGRTDDFVFAQVGDIEDVSELETISALPADSETGIWGVGLLRLQANLPDTLPGQNATILLLGDTELENRDEDTIIIAATANASAQVLASPDGILLRILTPGTEAAAFGRDETGEWIRVRAADVLPVYGWMEASLLDAEVDFADLPVVENEAALPPTPMQAFVLRTGIGDPTCADTPDGVLIHTPNEATTVQFTVNGVNISVASTIRLGSVESDGQTNLLLQTFEGTGVISTEFGVAVIPAGTQVSVPLDASGEAPSGAPTDPEPIPQADLDSVNVIVQSASYTGIIGEDAPVTVEQALSQDDVTGLAGIPDDVSTMNGTWHFVNYIRYQGGSACYRLAQAPGSYSITVTMGFTDTALTITYANGGSQSFSGDGDGVYAIAEPSETTYTIVSPTFLRYGRTVPTEYNQNGVDCVQSHGGFAIRIG